MRGGLLEAPFGCRVSKCAPVWGEQEENKAGEPSTNHQHPNTIPTKREITMNPDFLDPMTVATGILALFGGIAVLMVIDSWCKGRDKARAHAERLKALEVGQPLPDAEVAQAHADATRAWAAGLTATFVSLGLGGIA